MHNKITIPLYIGRAKYDMYNKSVISLHGVQQNHTFVVHVFFFTEKIA